MTSILHLEPSSKLVLAQSPWIATRPPVPQPSAALRWLTVAASCLASFAAGWAIQVFLVPLALQQLASAPVATPQIAAVAPAATPVSPTPEPEVAQPKAVEAAPPVITAAVPVPVPSEPIPVPRPTADFVNRPRTRFVARLDAQINIAPGMELTVSRIQGQRIDASLSLRTGVGILPMRNQGLLQIFSVDSAKGVDLIFTAADDRSVTGCPAIPYQHRLKTGARTKRSAPRAHFSHSTNFWVSTLGS